MDTAQPAMAAETDVNAQLSEAANAFKNYTSDQPIVVRDEKGRFASDTVEEQPEAEEAEPVEGDVEPDEGEEEATEAVEETQPMPPSWPADQAEQWEQLPAETQAFLANREAERERAVNAKFQESATARKEAESLREAADATRKEYIDSLQTLAVILNPEKPDPRAYGAGTGQYNREAYDLAVVEWENSTALLAQVKDQLAGLEKQEIEEAQTSYKAWLDANNAEFGPKFVSDVPELTDPAKGGRIIDGLVRYAAENGIDQGDLTPEKLTGVPFAHMHLLWKAQQYDKLRTQAPQAKPKPASPAVKPGVSSPRSAQRKATDQRARERLAREGSVEAGAAIWKNFLRG